MDEDSDDGEVPFREEQYLCTDLTTPESKNLSELGVTAFSKEEIDQKLKSAVTLNAGFEKLAPVYDPKAVLRDAAAQILPTPFISSNEVRSLAMKAHDLYLKRKPQTF